MKTIIRERYLGRIKALKDTPDIKIITGIRRSGKSNLMQTYIDYLKTNFDFIKAYLKEIKETFSLSNKDIWVHATEEDCLRYKEARDYGEIATGPFIPPLTLNQWLEWLSSDEDNFDKQVSQYYKL